MQNKHNLSRLKGFWFVLFLLLPLSLYAETPSGMMRLGGSWVELDRSGASVSATGNVEFEFKNGELTTNEVTYAYGQKHLSIPSHFFFNAHNHYFEASSLDYRGETFDGVAYDVSAKFGKFLITGDEFVISKNVVTVHNATFTTCDLDAPHFLVHSNKILVYPYLGLFVGLGNRMEAPFLPVDLWVPTYFYGSYSQGLLGPYTPIPRVGQTNREGFYIKHSLPYFIDSQSSGTVDFGNMWKLGLYLGVTHGYVFNKANKMSLALHTYGQDGLGGGVIYYYDLRERSKVSSDGTFVDDLFSTFSDAQQLPLTQVRLQMTYNELINDSRVDKAPVIHFDVNDAPLSHGFFLTSFSNFGRITEHIYDSEETFTSWRSVVDADLRRPIPFKKDWIFEPMLQFNKHWHDTGEQWERWFYGGSLQWLWPVLNPKLTYFARIRSLTSGSSPFEFAQQYAQVKDELGLELSTEVGKLHLGLDVAYNLEDDEYRKQDYKIGYNLHRLHVYLVFKSIEGQFQFGGHL